MAATACAAYPYEGTRPPLMPPARSSHVPEPPLDVDDGRGFAVKPAPPAPPSPPPPPPPPLPRPSKATSLFSRDLGLCTEGLGSESSGDVDLGDDITDAENINDDTSIGGVVLAGQGLPCKRQHRDGDEEPAARARSGRTFAFPPPISVIGAGGKPWLYLRPHRADGRLVLREVKIPSRELLQARREDGRFKLQFAHPEDDEHLADGRHQGQGQELSDAILKEQGQDEIE
ncbi:hypothetical protein ACP70R_026899 [Stipagrostis hirtigluma subsp. patula]